MSASKIALIEYVGRLAESSWRMCLTGSPSRMQSEWFDKMRAEPNVGDLVVISAVAPSTPWCLRVGWLVAMRDVPWGPPQDGERQATDRKWTIERLDDGSEFTWSNVQVLRVLEQDLLSHIQPVRRD